MPGPRKKDNRKIFDIQVPRHEDCWAKTTASNEPGVNVRDHCLNVGCVAEELLKRLPDSLKSALRTQSSPILASLHDVGKVSPGFQSKCASWLIKQGISNRALAEGWGTAEQDHAKTGQFTLQRILGRSKLWKWATIIGAHHGKPKGLQIPFLTEPAQDVWMNERLRLAQELIGVFGPLPDQPGSEAVLWFQAGLTAVADWLSSNENFFPLLSQLNIEKRRHLASEALDSIGWISPRFRRGISFENLFRGYSPNSLQSAALKIHDPGVYVIEGPMGSGKTEAALAISYELIQQGKANGIYFALPTQITSNRIHLRVRKFLEGCLDESSQLRLAHSTSWLQEDGQLLQINPTTHDRESKENAHEGRSWFASAKRALLAPFGVGTIDQALLGIVAANHFFVRQFGLAGKVVILDEVHSYDLYTGTLIDVLVQRLRELQSTVIILSATLTESRRRQLLATGAQENVSSAYPLLSGRAEGQIEIPCEPPTPKKIAIRWMAGDEVVEECMGRATQGQCVLWIRNTVDDAQEIYRALKSAGFEGGPEVALLHSRFPFFQRERLESDWMDRLGKDSTNRPNGCVLVATQVAEQSVDIDADLLITDLAPTDMLLQRMGRLWRHDRKRPGEWKPEIWIRQLALSDDQLMQARPEELREALGKSAKVYAPYVLLRSLQQWRGRNAITLPADIRDTLEATYSESGSADPAAWRQLHEELQQHKCRLADQALSNTHIWDQPALRDDEGVQTRFSNYPMAQLLLARSIESLNARTARLHLLEGETVEANDRHWNFGAARAIYRNLTRVPRWSVSAALANAPGWLTTHVSQPTAVGLLRCDGGIALLGKESETGLSYSSDQGILINRKHVARAVTQEESDESYD